VPMNLRSFRNWIHRIYGTKDAEPDCDLVSQSIPAYVDAELAGNDPAQCYPAVAHHLGQCPVCQDLYHAVQEAARVEREDEGAFLVSVRAAERSRTGD
jgi:hypothetical protein